GSGDEAFEAGLKVVGNAGHGSILRESEAPVGPGAGRPPFDAWCSPHVKVQGLPPHAVSTPFDTLLIGMATTQRDLYEVLGVGRNASSDEIKKVYRRLVM